MANDDKMICPECKVEMNFHAVKVDYTPVRSETESVDRAFGGVLQEFHSCPKCGTTATREEKTGG